MNKNLKIKKNQKAIKKKRVFVIVSVLVVLLIGVVMIVPMTKSRAEEFNPNINKTPNRCTWFRESCLKENVEDIKSLSADCADSFSYNRTLRIKMVDTCVDYSLDFYCKRC